MTVSNDGMAHVPIPPDGVMSLVAGYTRQIDGKRGSVYSSVRVDMPIISPHEFIRIVYELRQKVRNGEVTSPFETPDKPATEVAENAFGIGIIGEMSRDDLLAEIRAHQTEAMSLMDVNMLKKFVIHLRMTKYQRRLHEEAKFDIPPGMLGMFGLDDD